MNRGLTETIVSDDTDEEPAKTSPAFGTIALRFVTLLIVIVAAFAWAWSR